MWTSTLELSPKRVLPTRLFGLFWRGAYFSSIAPLQIQNLPRHSLPSTSWVRVRNRLAGICGSDLHQVYGDGDFRISPAALPRHIHTYPGHEVVGEVIEVGEEVQQLGVGDRVVLQHSPNCLTAGTQPLCRSCAVGNYNLCENGALPDPQQIGGGWSEEMLLHEQQLFLAPTGMSDEQAVMLEPTAVALRAVLHSFPQPGDRVLIIGAGTIGLLILNIVRALAPETEVSILARHAFQVEQATRMGATHIVYPQDSYTSIQRATGARLYRGLLGNQTLLGGYDIIYDTVGNTKTVHDALRWARAQANVVMVGLNLHFMRVDLSPIWSQEVNLIGTSGHGMENWPVGTREWRSTFDIASELILHGLIHPERLVTHRFALNNYREALNTAMNKNNTGSIKVTFDYALQPASVVPNVRAAARPRRPLMGTPPSSTIGLLGEQPPTPMPVEPRPLEEPEPVAQQPRLTTGSMLEQSLLAQPELVVPEDGDVTAKSAVPTSEQLAIRSQEKSKQTKEFSSPPTPTEEPRREDESTLRFKRPNLPKQQTPPTSSPPESLAARLEAENQLPEGEQETQSFAPIPRIVPEVPRKTKPEAPPVQVEESEQDIVTVRQSKPISLPALFRQEPQVQEPENAVAQEASLQEPENIVAGEMAEPVSQQPEESVVTASNYQEIEASATGNPVKTPLQLENIEFQDTSAPAAIETTQETISDQAEQPQPVSSESPDEEAPITLEAQAREEPNTLEIPDHEDQTATPEIRDQEEQPVTLETRDQQEQTVTSKASSIPTEHEWSATTPDWIDELEAETSAENASDRSQSAGPDIETKTIPVLSSLQEQVANVETVHIPTPTAEQLASAAAETVPTPATHAEDIAEMETRESSSVTEEDLSPERYEFAGPISEIEDAETLPELTYEPESLYFPEPDFSLHDDEPGNPLNPHTQPAGSELTINYQQIAHSSEALPEPESYETTIFDIPPDEQLNWLSSMQETEKEAAIDPDADASSARNNDAGSSQGKIQSSRSNKARKRRH